MHLVLIDHSPTACWLMKRLLENEGHRVETFSTPLAALSAIWQRPPDALIVEVQLPQLDGYEVAQMVRTKAPDALRSLPIIGLSARNGVLDRVKGRLSGMNAYLTKPIDTRDLLAVLH